MDYNNVNTTVIVPIPTYVVIIWWYSYVVGQILQRILPINYDPSKYRYKKNYGNLKKKKTNKKVVFNKKKNGLLESNLLFYHYHHFLFHHSIGIKFDSIEKYFKKKKET